MVPLHLFYPIHPKMPLEMIAGSQIYHNKSSGKNYGLLGSVGTMREQRSAARGEVLVRFGDFRTTVSYSLDWIRENCWIRSTDLSEHHAFNLKPFLEKYVSFAVENVKHIPQDINHSQIKQVVDHAEAVAKQKARQAPVSVQTVATTVVQIARETANKNTRLKFLTKHSTLNPRNLRDYLKLLMNGEPLHVKLPTHIAQFYSIGPVVLLTEESVDRGGAGRVEVQAHAAGPFTTSTTPVTVPLVAVFASITPEGYQSLHNGTVHTRAAQWYDACVEALSRWPKEIDTRNIQYQFGKHGMVYKVYDVSLAPSGTVAITGFRHDNGRQKTAVTFGQQTHIHVSKYTEGMIPNQPESVDPVQIDMDEPRRHLLAVRLPDGKLEVIRICQTYRITDNAAKNFLINDLHEKLTMYAESDVLVHVDTARDLGSDVRLETRKVWKEVQTYERELQISVRKSQS